MVHVVHKKINRQITKSLFESDYPLKLKDWYSGIACNGTVLLEVIAILHSKTNLTLIIITYTANELH